MRTLCSVAAVVTCILQLKNGTSKPVHRRRLVSHFVVLHVPEEKTDDTTDVIAPSPPFLLQTSRTSGKTRAPARTNSSGYTDLLREFTLPLQQNECRRRPPALYAERLVRDAVKSASEARPPANFVLYPDGTVVRRSEEEEEEEDTGGDPPPAQAPLFDGAVANTTPGGGTGTALHAAVALDRPFLLALLLAMGADGRSCHTAFRRLMVHEAACNGSMQCLTILLEVGRECGAAVRAQAAAWEAAQKEQQQQQRSSRGRNSTRRETATANGEQSPSSLSQSSSYVKSNAGPKATLDTLSLLRQFQILAKSVEKGDLTELDAARKLFRLATLSEATKISLAKQGGFFDDEQVRSVFRTILANHPSSDGHGNTPLHWAAFKNETDCVSLLLRYGANANARAHPSGWTPLHDAAYSNSRDSIALLVDAGACVDARANSGATPLCFAAQENAAAAAELLLIRGANVTLRCIPALLPHANTRQSMATRFCGYTPLHYCAHYNADAAAIVILSHHTACAALELVDLNDRTPLHVAVARGSAAVVRALLQAGAAVSQQATQSVKSLIPAQPVQSSKPWNCVSQRSIDECQLCMSTVEQHWTPQRHALFTPADRLGVLQVLQVGKRLELDGQVPFVDMWPEVLSFCGRGWFDTTRAGGEETETEMEGGDVADVAWVVDESVVLPSFC